MTAIALCILVAMLIAIGIWAYTLLPDKHQSPSEYDAQIDEEENT